MSNAVFHRSRAAWLFSALLVGAFVLSGTGVAGAARSVQPHRKAMTNIHIDLNWLPNVEFSGIWVAIHKGWFRKAGLNIPGITSGLGAGVRPYDYSDTPESENDLCLKQSKMLCIGIDDSSAIPIARQVGHLVKGIWTGSQKTPFGFMTCYVPPKHKVYNKCKSNNSVASSGKNITSPKQWKGLTIGYQSDELYVPELMLGSVGLSLSDVHAIQVNFNTGDLTSGTVAAHLVFVNNEPVDLGLKGVKTNTISAYKYGMGAFYADTMFADDSQIGKYKSQIKTFVHLVDKGWKYAMHNPKSSASMIVKSFFTAANGGGSSQVKQQQIEIGQFAKTLSRDKAGKVDGQMTLARWKTIIHDLKTTSGSPGGNPIITSNISPASCFTDQFAPPGAK